MTNSELDFGKQRDTGSWNARFLCSRGWNSFWPCQSDDAFLVLSYQYHQCYQALTLVWNIISKLDQNYAILCSTTQWIFTTRQLS